MPGIRLHPRTRTVERAKVVRVPFGAQGVAERDSHEVVEDAGGFGPAEVVLVDDLVQALPQLRPDRKADEA